MARDKRRFPANHKLLLVAVIAAIVMAGCGTGLAPSGSLRPQTTGGISEPSAALSFAPAPFTRTTPASANVVQCTELDGSPPRQTITDETGLIKTCARIAPTEVASPSSADQQGLTLDLPMSGSPCDVIQPLRFTKEQSLYYLRSIHPPGPCVASRVETALRLTFSAPISRSSLYVLLGDAAATPPPLNNQFACGLSSGPVLTDRTGLVASCEVSEIADIMIHPGLSVTPAYLTASWQSPTCNDAPTALFEDSSDGGYQLLIEDLPPPATGEACPGGLATETLTLTLRLPTVVPVNATVNGQVLPGPAVSATSPATVTNFAGDGFSFYYPANWNVLTGYEHFGLHGPTIYAAVGLGSIDSGCTLDSTAVYCGPSPIWAVPDDGIVLAYHIPGWAPGGNMPSPSLESGQVFVGVGGRQAIFSQTQYNSMKWMFTDAPDLIEIRWGKDFGQTAPEIAQEIIDSWHFDPGFQP